MKNNPKVVSFERSPAYVHHRAMLNRRENNMVDALELMRSAVEKSPENSEYKLDLAEMYCEIGCHEQSSRLLLDMLAEGNGPSECYYGLALNQLGMNDVSGAKKTLNLYHHKDPGGALAEEVTLLQAELDMYTQMNRPISRKLYRASRIADRACEAMRENMPEKACRLFERTLTLEPEQFEMRALYAMSLMMLGDAEAAKKQAERAAVGFPPSVRALCVCAQVFNMLDEPEKALDAIRRAEAEHPIGTELRLMIHTLGEMDMDADAAEYARLALQETPYDRELLHIRAVALKRSGRSDAEVLGFWTRILRLDPEDSIAAFYEACASEGRLDEYELDFGYQVPDTEYARRLKALIEHINQGFEHACEAWKTDEDFKRLVCWAVSTEDLKIGRVSMTVLATMDSDEAGSILRELLFNGEVLPELKMHAAMLLRLRGVELEKFLPPDVDPADGLLPEADGMLSCIQVGERQLVRYANEVLEREYDVSALSALTLMWAAYRKSRGTRVDPLIRVESASAALAYYYLLTHGQKPDIKKLASDFGCKVRQMVYYARRIAGCLEKENGNA